jgi:hypothetical protein
MISAARGLRTLRVLALLIQLALPALAGVADARLEAAAAAEATHVESADHDCHTRGHPADCAVCQFLRTIPLTAGAPVEPPATTVAILPPGNTLLPGGRSPVLRPLPRGPPRLS